MTKHFVTPHTYCGRSLSPQRQTDRGSRQSQIARGYGSCGDKICQGKSWSEELNGKELHGAAWRRVQSGVERIRFFLYSKPVTIHQLYKHLEMWHFFFSFSFSFISLIADGPHHYHPACGHKGSSHLSPVHALHFFYRDASSALLQLVNQWLNFTYSRFHAFGYERKNTNPTLVRIELTTSVLADVQLTY